MSGIKFYCLDTETTGLKSTDYHNEITQLCAIRVDDKLQYDKVIRAHYPEHAQAMALQITGKTHADLRQGVERMDAVESFEAYLNADGLKPNARCIIAHNASFDRRFLQELWSQCGRVFPADLWIDTIPMIRAYGKRQGMVKVATNLEASCSLLGVGKKVAGAHNAISDTRNLYFLWNKLIQTEDYLEYVKRFPHGNDSDESSD